MEIRVPNIGDAWMAEEGLTASLCRNPLKKRMLRQPAQNRLSIQKIKRRPPPPVVLHPQTIGRTMMFHRFGAPF